MKNIGFWNIFWLVVILAVVHYFVPVLTTKIISFAIIAAFIYVIILIAKKVLR